MRAPGFVLVGSLLAACGGGGGKATTVDAADVDAALADAAPQAPCPDGQFATQVAASGAVTCAPIDAATAIAIRSRCQVYLGQRDSCNGCADPPAKWSETDPLSCSPGVGAGNTCVTATLDPGLPQALATVDLDGDVNGDDKLYAGLHCIAAPRTPAPAPCQDGWAITGKSGNTWECAPVSEAAIGYVGAHCAIYLGWQDGCDGCTTAPAKWGFANDATCQNGAGADDTCTTTTLGGQPVNLFGVSPDGDVDGNDKLHLGLHCDAPATGTTSATGTCPTGSFVVGTNPDGSLACGDPASVIANYVASKCTLYFGWHDSCDACTDVPTKWGKTSTTACANGAGADDTCGTFTLGANTVTMFGLSPDGNVNADDTLYVGLRCDK